MLKDGQAAVLYSTCLCICVNSCIGGKGNSNQTCFKQEIILQRVVMQHAWVLYHIKNICSI